MVAQAKDKEQQSLSTSQKPCEVKIMRADDQFIESQVVQFNKLTDAQMVCIAIKNDGE